MYVLNVNCSGNKKLINTADICFIIWNLPARATCPYATPECLRKCYATNPENRFPETRASRVRNFLETKSDEFTANMIYTIERKISHYTRRNKKIVVRIHESGDFYNKRYAAAWLEVARHFENNGRVVFMAYTKSAAFFEGEEIPSNMVLRFSVWSDTKPEEIERARRMGLPIYTAGTPEDVENMVNRDGYTKCECADCANCGKCWDGSHRRIACVIHGKPSKYNGGKKA